VDDDSGRRALLFSPLIVERAGAATTQVELHNAQGDSVGTATLEAMPEGVKIVLQAAKLPPGQHGLAHPRGREM